MKEILERGRQTQIDLSYCRSQKVLWQYCNDRNLESLWTRFTVMRVDDVDVHVSTFCITINLLTVQQHMFDFCMSRFKNWTEKKVYTWWYKNKTQYFRLLDMEPHSWRLSALDKFKLDRQTDHIVFKSAFSSTAITNCAGTQSLLV